MTSTTVDNYSDSSAQPSNQEDDLIDLGELWETLLDGKWFILLVALIFTFLGVVKAFLDSPVYRVDALLQVNEQSQTLTGLDPFSGSLESKIPVMTEIGVIKSRMILGKAVRNLDLDVTAQPKYFPIIGKAVARYVQDENQHNVVSNFLLEQFGYAWTGEEIQIESIAIPADWENNELVIVTGEHNDYQLFYEDELILKGRVGKQAGKRLEGYRSPIRVFVSLLKARPGTKFTIIKHSRVSAIDQLKETLKIKENGQNSGLLELTLESHKPGHAVTVLNEIADIYVQQNVEHKSAESQKTLEFLEKQLPELKAQLDEANRILNEYKNRKGSIDLSVETKNILDNVVEIKTKQTLLYQQRDELRQRYTEAHPSVVALDKQIERLQRQIYSHDAMVKNLPETQQIILDLSGDVEVKTNLYTTLLNNAQTLRVAKAGTIGDVRIIDYAELPDRPIKPKKILIIGVALVCGLFLGVLAVFVRKSMRRGVEDPNLIEKQLNVPIYATVPYSAIQEKIANKYYKKSFKGGFNPKAILALEAREDMAIESLRSLRTTLHFSLLDAKNNIIVITGPSIGIGKSFISTNLATILADGGKKVLLIDGDMRKGYLNKILGVNRENGLSELIVNNITVDKATHTIEQVNFDFIATGAIPPNPSELLLHQNFILFLETVSEQYDLVIIDSPPILAVTDAAIIGRMAGATLMVAKSGEHPMGEIEQGVKKLVNAGVSLKGVVFNAAQVSSSRYSSRQYVYQYSYGNGS